MQYVAYNIISLQVLSKIMFGIGNFPLLKPNYTFIQKENRLKKKTPPCSCTHLPQVCHNYSKLCHKNLWILLCRWGVFSRVCTYARYGCVGDSKIICKFISPSYPVFHQIYPGMFRKNVLLLHSAVNKLMLQGS